MQEVGSGLLNIHDLPHGGIVKLGKLFERNEDLMVSGVQPETMFGDVCDCNSRSVFAMSDGSHLHTTLLERVILLRASKVMDRADTRLSCFRKTFPPKNLRHILLVQKHVGDEAIVDISAARHDADRAAAE